MADFTTNVSGPQGGGFTPPQPVVDQSGLQSLQAFGNLANTVGRVGAQLFANQAAQQRQDAFNKQVASFTTQQLALAQAVDSGKMTSSEARTRARANYTAAISNNPGLTEVLADTQKKILSSSGLGGVILEGTQQEQASQALQKEATLNGWITPNADPAQQQQGIAAYSQFKRYQQDLEQQQKLSSLRNSEQSYQRGVVGLATDKIQLQTAGISQQTAKLNLVNAQEQRQSRQALGGMAQAGYFKFDQDMGYIEQQYRDGKIDSVTAQKMAQQQFGALQQVVGQVGQNAGGEYVNNMMSPMKFRFENSVKYLTGQMDQEALNTQNNTTVAKAELNALGDPDTARTVAASRLLGPAAVNAPALNAAAMRMMGQNMNPSSGKPGVDVIPSDSRTQKDVGDYLTILKHGMTDVNAGDKDGAKLKELNTHVSNVLSSINVHNLAVDNPSDYNNVVDFLSSPEFGAYAKKNGGVPADSATNAMSVLRTQYIDKAIPAIQQEFKNAEIDPKFNNFASDRMGLATAESQRSKPVESVIQPQYIGGGVQFVTRSNDADVQRKARELNKGLGQVVNKLIRMEGNLSGRDYKAVYDSLAPQLFGDSNGDKQQQQQ